MQNTSNDTKHRYKLILCSILILEWDFLFNFNLKLNNVTETTSFNTWRAFLKRPENFSGPETVPQSYRNDFRVFLKAPEKF